MSNMDTPLLGELTAGDHAQRLIALSGALAECAVTRISLETADAELIDLEARTTDLPGLLARTPTPLALHVRARTLIAISPTRINWVTHAPDIHQALTRAASSLG